MTLPRSRCGAGRAAIWARSDPGAGRSGPEPVAMWAGPAPNPLRACGPMGDVGRQVATWARSEPQSGRIWARACGGVIWARSEPDPSPIPTMWARSEARRGGPDLAPIDAGGYGTDPGPGADKFTAMLAQGMAPLPIGGSGAGSGQCGPRITAIPSSRPRCRFVRFGAIPVGLP